MAGNTQTLATAIHHLMVAVTLSDYRAVKSSGSITQKFMVGVSQKVECSYYFLKRGAGENPSTLWVI